MTLHAAITPFPPIQVVLMVTQPKEDGAAADALSGVTVLQERRLDANLLRQQVP
jgi:hypothetical protein